MMLALLHNPVADLRGPDFLVLYGVAIVVTIVLCRVWGRASIALAMRPAPQVPPDPDPYEIGYLRGGENEVVRLAILSLMERGYLRSGIPDPRRHSRTSETPIEQAIGHPDLRGLSALEREAFNAFGVSRTAGDIFRKSALPMRMKTRTAGMERELVEKGLLASAADRFRSGAIRGAGIEHFAVVTTFAALAVLAASPEARARRCAYLRVVGPAPTLSRQPSVNLRVFRLLEGQKLMQMSQVLIGFVSPRRGNGL